MMHFIEAYAKEKGYSRIELNMWAFNEEALAFYEAAGFSTYRRYLEKSICPITPEGETALLHGGKSPYKGVP